jgi:hypothetical protein
MIRKTVKSAGMGRDVQLALSTEPDYTIAFTQKVASLQSVIAEALAAPVEHDDDMNYSSAQKLAVWLDARCNVVPTCDPKAAYRLIDFVSSRGPFFTFIALGLSASTDGWIDKGLDKPARYWSRVSEDKLPDGIQRLQQKIASIMESKCIMLLDDSILSQESEGHFTRLDGRPATVFEALFSEMY